jgi:hypothetical protein
MVTRSLCLLFLLALSASAQTPRIPPPESVNRNGLVGRWLVPGYQTGNGLTPTQAMDASGKNFNATLVNQPPFLVYKCIPALSLDGAKYATIANSPLGSIGPNSTFTLVAWMAPATAQGPIADRRSAIAIGAAQNDFEAVIGSPYVGGSPNGRNYLSLEVGKSYVASQKALSQSTYQTNRWYQLVGVFRNGGADFYVDGKWQSTIVYNATILSASSNSNIWGIGTEPDLFAGTFPYKVTGNLADVRIYNRALSAAEIAAIYRGLQ